VTAQGWDRADFSCGRCGHIFSATTEQDYLIRRTLHDSAHDLVVMMPEQLRVEVLRILAGPGLMAGTGKTFWASPLGDAAQLVANSGDPGAGHECRDCPRHGGTGFDCHHLVRGRRLADSCTWCQERGLTVGQMIPGQMGTTA
jgi:hypothetical protein